VAHVLSVPLGTDFRKRPGVGTSADAARKVRALLPHEMRAAAIVFLTDELD
jgi:hypothetical protein